jgi:hypothetical protein
LIAIEIGIHPQIRNPMKHYARILLAALLPLQAIPCLHAEDEILRNALGHPVEGELAAFLGDPLLQRQTVFEDQERVREPYLGVALDGTLLVMRNYDKILRRSEDGGLTWGAEAEVPFGFLDSNFIVDETSGDILVLRLWDGADKAWRSQDGGKTWN